VLYRLRAQVRNDAFHGPVSATGPFLLGNQSFNIDWLRLQRRHADCHR
jgi:hypothetical protein